MQRVLDFLAGLGLGLFVVSGWTAYTRTPQLHALVGLSTGMVLLLMHTLVFIFFIGTGRAVKEAVVGRGLPASFQAEDKRFMAQIIAPGSFGPLTIVVASFLGAAPSEIVRFWIHPGLIALAVLVNAWAFLLERRDRREAVAPCASAPGAPTDRRRRRDTGGRGTCRTAGAVLGRRRRAALGPDRGRLLPLPPLHHGRPACPELGVGPRRPGAHADRRGVHAARAWAIISSLVRAPWGTDS